MILRKDKRWFLPLLIAGLVVLQIGCKSAAKTEQPAETVEEKHWGYAGDVGPAYWAELGFIPQGLTAQSPINIDTAALTSDGAPAKPEFHYAGTSFKAENNGHTIELVPADGSNTITLDGTEYVFQQLHFHGQSEHTVDDAFSPMEVHLVHKAGDAIAVVGFLINAGAENETFKEAFANLPIAESTEAELEEQIDLSTLLADSPGFYRYEGSLTTPPCTEGVQWSVANTFLEFSQEQIDAFTAIYPPSPGNNRPVQDLNGRTVYASN